MTGPSRKGVPVAERLRLAVKGAHMIDEVLPRMETPIPPWAPSLLVEPQTLWGQPAKKLRRVA